MSNFITNYIEGCDKCQHYQKDLHPKAQVHPQEVAEGPWQLIRVDLIGPLPMSCGKDMILNIVDYYTKQIHLFSVTPLHGISQNIISDRGPQFATRSMHALYK